MTGPETIARLRGRTLDLLAEWTPIRSFAGNEAGLKVMAQTLIAHLRDDLGATIIADGLKLDPPVVHARIERGAPVTILLYNMYDVMPATLEGWSVDPFIGGVIEGPKGPRYVGRGAENNKGPMAAMLVALAHLIATSTLDANIEILLEGQEETGSGALRRYLTAQDTPVRRTSTALFPSFCEYGGGPPRIYFGFKGLAQGRISVESGDWGGPMKPCHASNSPWIANPIWELAKALAGLDGGSRGAVALPAPLAPVLDVLAATFDPQAELAFRAASRFSRDGTPRELLEHVLTAAHLNLAEVSSSPLGGRSVIPTGASARFDMRLPAGLDPDDEIARLARDCAPALLSLDDAYPGCWFDPAALGFAELAGSYRALGANPQSWPWAIGAAPAYAFAGVSDAFIIGGLGHGGNAHGPDEFVELSGIDRFIQSLLLWLPAIAAKGRS
ncbi:M20 family metallopeptidase [Bosea sp. 685]|uniref:M20 family metallopeptidase n=1 Tax=Bosea sp. 685 TaxID=3080057 RepID=UPI0028930909|nr:M20/M25/M40 family metallo-hydrolase [Bosea sp. 685]WNJ90291.1 M20/M25/M40 family metallo-hydrolase [Bosea sp. 685]